MSAQPSQLPIDRTTPSRAAINVIAILLLLLVVMPAASRAGDFKDLLSGKTYPLTVKLGDLGKEWRRITIRTTGSASGNISVSISGNSNSTSGSSQNNIADLAGSKVYLTKGQTASANGVTYLVAYRLPGGGIDLPALIQVLATKSAPELNPLTVESVLPLSVLDVKCVGSLDEIRAFDLKREIAESEKVALAISTALKSLSGGTTNRTTVASPDKPAK